MPMTTHCEPKRDASSSIRPGLAMAGELIGDLLGAGIEHGFGVFDRADAAGDAEGNVEHLRHAPHPGAVHAAALGAGGDVVEHDFVRALVAIALGELEDVAHDLVIAEADALDDLAVADVEAGDDAFGKNGR